jgi:hypothetical protein
MPALTPYAGQFLGREIDKGRMNLDLGYRLEGRHLVGENKMMLDQLELGKKIESPEATHLPVGLAIAILKDSDGKIDIDLPVEGGPGRSEVQDRPDHLAVHQESARQGRHPRRSSCWAICSAAVEMMTSSAPSSSIPASGVLAVQDTASVNKVAEALVKRPQLNIEVRGSTDEALDALGIRKAKFAALADEKIAANPKRYGTGIGYSSKLLHDLLSERLGKKSVGDFEKRFATTAGALAASDPRYKEGSKREVVDEAKMNVAIQDTLTALMTAGRRI